MIQAKLNNCNLAMECNTDKGIPSKELLQVAGVGTTGNYASARHSHEKNCAIPVHAWQGGGRQI
eukprot:2531533-Amphidinium_carterae.1